MPITQDRMKNLIAAALDYQRAFNTIISAVSSAAQRARFKPESAAEELAFLSTLANPIGLLHTPMDSPAIILTEHRHFVSHSGRNNYERKRQQKRRREQLMGLAVNGKVPYPIAQVNAIREEMYEVSPMEDDGGKDLTDDMKTYTGFHNHQAVRIDESLKAEIEAEAEREIARQQREKDLLQKMDAERYVGPPTFEDTKAPEAEE